MKKLYKNEHDEVLTGVIGGIGEYFSVDPTILRIAFVVLVLITGVFPGIIAYIIAYFIIPTSDSLKESDRSTHPSDEFRPEKPHGVSTLVTPPPMKTEPKPEAKEEQKEEVKKDEPKVEARPEPVVEAPKAPVPITAEESAMTIEDLMTPKPFGDRGEEMEKADIAEEPKSPTEM